MKRLLLLEDPVLWKLGTLYCKKCHKIIPHSRCASKIRRFRCRAPTASSDAHWWSTRTPTTLASADTSSARPPATRVPASLAVSSAWPRFKHPTSVQWLCQTLDQWLPDVGAVIVQHWHLYCPKIVQLFHNIGVTIPWPKIF